MFDFVFETDNTITLIDRPPTVSREVKPVWFQELDNIKADEFFDYERGPAPLLWRVANRYYYKGALLFKTKNRGENENPPRKSPESILWEVFNLVKRALDEGKILRIEIKGE